MKYAFLHCQFKRRAGRNQPRREIGYMLVSVAFGFNHLRKHDLRSKPSFQRFLFLLWTDMMYPNYVALKSQAGDPILPISLLIRHRFRAIPETHKITPQQFQILHSHSPFYSEILNRSNIYLSVQKTCLAPISIPPRGSLRYTL